MLVELVRTNDTSVGFCGAKQTRMIARVILLSTSTVRNSVTCLFLARARFSFGVEEMSVQVERTASSPWSDQRQHGACQIKAVDFFLLVFQSYMFIISSSACFLHFAGI